jgi:hypothetical protein
MAIQEMRGSAIEIWRCLDSSAMICRKLYQVGATWLIQRISVMISSVIMPDRDYIAAVRTCA